VVIPFVVYPYLKRFTWLCHVWLGLCIGLAPVAAYVAVADAVPLASFWLLGVVGFWIAGFDIIYATMDLEHDRAEGIHSAPADLGLGPALWLARAMHAASVVSMAGVGVWAALAWPYWFAVAACAALLVYEHAIVRVDDLRRVNQAFFNVNVILAAIYLAGVIAALVVR
jgi:4-hydroxybenzoate polyprenyltransferase